MDRVKVYFVGRLDRIYKKKLNMEHKEREDSKVTLSLGLSYCYMDDGAI